jgi:hypothetical protein
MVFTRVNKGFIPEQDHFIQGIDTMKMSYIDSIHYSFRGNDHYLLKFYGLMQDSIPYTIYFGDTLGLIKQYSNYPHHSFELGKPVYEECYRYKFLNATFNALRRKDSDFHSRFGGGERWINASLVERAPKSQKKKSKAELLQEIITENE